MNAERWAGRAIVGLRIVMALVPWAMRPQEVVAQQHVNGLTAEISCPGGLVCPSDAGTTVPCQVTVENRDPDHGLTGLTVEAGVRVVTPVSGCATSLAASDGLEGAGPDFTQCTFNLELTVELCFGLNAPTIFAEASGVDADPVSLPQGFGGLPVEGSVLAALSIDILPHSARLDPTLDCEGAGIGPVTCRLTVENQDLYHGVTGIAFTKQAGFPKGPIRKIEPGCATTLGRGDGVAGSGADFTSCTFQEPLEDVCGARSEAQIQLLASGRDDVEGGLTTSGTVTSGVVLAFACGEGHLAALATRISCPSVVGESSSATCTISIENRDRDHGVEGLGVGREILLPDPNFNVIEGCADALPPSDGVDGGGPDLTVCTTEVSLRQISLNCEGPFVVVGIRASAGGVDADPNPLASGGCGGLAVSDQESTSVLFLCDTP